MLSVCVLKMAKATKNDGVIIEGEYEDVEVVLEDGLLQYAFQDGRREAIVRLSFCCDDEQKLKADIEEYLYERNKRLALGACDGEEFYLYVLRPPMEVENIEEGG